MKRRGKGWGEEGAGEGEEDEGPAENGGGRTALGRGGGTGKTSLTQDPRCPLLNIT